MRVLVTFAVDAEFAPWRKLRSFQKVRSSKSSYFKSDMNGVAIDVILTGIGAKTSWLDTAHEIYDCEIQMCISAGMAGALRPEHRVGEILVAQKVLAPPRDMTAFSDPSLITAAVSLGAKGVSTFYTSDRVIASAEEKRKLCVFADAVEMESFEVMFEGGMFAEKTVAIRVISDGAEQNLPIDFNRATTDAGTVSMSRLLGEVARHPASVWGLIQFAQQSKMAGEKLGEFLERYIKAVTTEPKLEVNQAGCR